MTTETTRHRRLTGALFIAALMLSLCGGCRQGEVPGDTSTAAPAALQLIPPEHYPRFSDDLAMDGIAAALDNSIAYYAKVPPDRSYRFGPDRYPADHLLASCRRLKALLTSGMSGETLNTIIRNEFRVYCVGGNDHAQPVLTTGYYEPLLDGSRTPDHRYRYPVYGRPAGMITVDLSRFNTAYEGRLIGHLKGSALVPYPDRHGIEEDRQLGEDAPILAWVDDRVDLFFLQIQGSGRIRLAEGGIMPVLYHGTNGHPYRSIGKLLIDRGAIAREAMSMQAIRRYLAAHPDEVNDILDHNPSYVFFRSEKGGPFGSLGVPVTAGRSIATDPTVFPPGAPALLVTRIPLIDGDGNVDHWNECRRFVANQDTGGAIRSAARADLFFGSGDYAEVAAGHMRQPGQLFFLVAAGKSP